MPASKHYNFTEFTLEGREFIKLWNKANKDGIQNKLAEKFNISVPTVYRIRKELKLPNLHSKEHPGRSKLIRRIKKHYYNDRSSIWIAKIRSVNLSPESVRKILLDEGVEMHPSHVTNPLYFPFKNNNRGHVALLKEMKELYLNGTTAAAIAKKFNLDQNAVSKKLKLMGIELKQNHRKLKGGYKCLWCGKVMKTVWQNKGPRKQIYCCSQCKSKAKDFRRMHKGQKYSENRMNMMVKFLKKTWGNNYETQAKKIMKVRKCITQH